MNSGNFQLSLVLSAINRTGSAFGAIYRSADKMEERTRKFQKSQNDLLSIGTGVSVGMAGYILKSGMELDNIKTRFEVFLKDGNKAKQMLNELNDFANLTPFSNGETYRAAQALLPYIKDSKEIRKELTMVGDIASGLNIPFAELARIYGKLKGGDLIQGEELDQLRDRGFAMRYLAQALGTTEDKIKGLGKDGAIHFKHLQKAFQLATQEGGDFYQMTEKMSQRAGGKLSTAVGTAQYSVANMSEKLMPTMVHFLDEIIPLIDAFSQWVEKNPELAKGLMEVSLGLAGLNVGSKVMSFMYNGAALNISKFMNMAVSIHRVTQAYNILRTAQQAGDMVTWYRTLENYGREGNIAATMLGRARLAQMGFNASILANPYVIAIAGLVALAGVVYMANQRMTELNETEQMKLDIMQEATSQVAKEHSEFTKLWRELEKTNPESAKFNEIKKELLAKYPQYLNKIDLEKSKIGDLPNLYQKATNAMLLYAAQKAAAEKGEKAQQDWSKAYLEEKQARNVLAKTGGNLGDALAKVLPQEISWMAYEFSQGKDVNNAMNDKKQAEKDMANAELLAKSIAEEIKKVSITVVSEPKLDGKTVAKSTNEVNNTNNRGKY